MTATTKPEIGATVIANGIETNYLEDGSGEDTVLLIHGSGPGVTSYANWRLVIPALAAKFRVIAPDMVGFGFSERPKDVDVQLADMGGSSHRADGHAWNREEPAWSGTASAARLPFGWRLNTPSVSTSWS